MTRLYILLMIRNLFQWDNCFKRKDFFYSHYVFKGAKLAKFIRFEAGWKMMRDDVICDDVVMW